MRGTRVGKNVWLYFIFILPGKSACCFASVLDVMSIGSCFCKWVSTSFDCCHETERWSLPSILGRSRCQQSQLPPVTSCHIILASELEACDVYDICVYIYIYLSLSPFLYYTYTCDILWFSSSWFPSCFFSWSSISQMIQVVAATPPVTVTDMKDIYRVGVSCCQIGSVKSSSWDWGLRVDVIDPLIH